MSGRDWLIWLALILVVMVAAILIIAGSSFVPSSVVRGY